MARAVTAIVIASSPFASRAEELTGPVANRAFLFAGADLTRNYSFVWTGLTSIPFGEIGEDGLRLRAMGGTGQYRYRTDAFSSGENRGSVTSGELLVGNRVTIGPAILTGYAGLDAKDYRLRNPDPGNPESGSRLGIKAAFEVYARTASDRFATAYGNISSVFATYALRVALHHELAPGLALGVESGLLGDRRYDEQRAGLIATLTIPKASFTAAVGVARNSGDGSGAYMTLTAYAPF